MRALRRWDYERRQFPRWPNAFRGAFASFEEARRSIRGATGYDHAAMAEMYDDRIGRPEGEVELIIALRPRDRAGV